MANQEQVYENVDLQVIKLLFNSDNGDYKVYAVRMLAHCVITSRLTNWRGYILACPKNRAGSGS